MRRATRGLSAATCVGLALLCASLAAPSVASAASTRNFDTEIAGLTAPGAPVPGPFALPVAVAVDGSGDAWVLDRTRRVIAEYDPLGGYLAEQNPINPETGNSYIETEFSDGIVHLAIDNATGAFEFDGTEPLVDHNGQTADWVDLFTGAGEHFKHLNFTAGNACRVDSLAADNSGGADQGRFYVVHSCYYPSETAVDAFNPSGEAADFTASEPYIPVNEHGEDENEITGTPSYSFSHEGGQAVAVDSQGDIYVGENQTHSIAEFKSNGEFVREFAISNSDFRSGLAIDPLTGNLLFPTSSAGSAALAEYSPTGTFLGQLTGPSPTESFYDIESLAFSPEGYLYVDEEGEGRTNPRVNVFLPSGFAPQPVATTAAATEIHRTTAALHGEAQLGGGTPVEACRFEYVAAPEYEPWADHPYAKGATAPCLNSSGEEVGTPAEPIEAPTELHAPLSTIHAGTTYHFRLSLTNSNHVPRDSSDRTFEALPAVTELKTLAATEITQESALLHGSYEAEESIPTSYFFEYGTSTHYGHSQPLEPAPVPGEPTGATEVKAPIESLVSNTIYHYRVVAENSFGTTDGEDQTFTTYQPPTIEGVSSSEVSATTAVLDAKVNPDGLPSGTEAECHFEYGLTTSYGATAPCPSKLSGTTGQFVEVKIEGLQRGATYHFRLVVENRWGAVTSEDQSFEFSPPSCPNSAVRQQTSSAYLPDCRAYELVSPASANGSLFYSAGPTSPTATSPSRFAYSGAFSSPPEATETIGTNADLYLATRTDTGWVSHYIGLPGSQAACMGPSPDNPWVQATQAEKFEDYVLTDPTMSQVLDFDDGPGLHCYIGGNGNSDATWQLDPPSDAPYLWGSDGDLLAHLPSDLNSVPGAPAALLCPVAYAQDTFPLCSTEVTASPDLTHLIFSSRTLSFSEPGQPAGLTGPPGSAYDDDLATGKVTLISTLKETGGPIPQDPAYANVRAQCGQDVCRPGEKAVTTPGGAEEFLRFPAVSTDGSHILISTATQPTAFCDKSSGTTPSCPRFTDTPIRLYMSIDDRPAVEVSKNELTGEDIAVDYVGMTPDGSRVFFTSEEHLTAEDPGHAGASLYMWSQQGEEEGKPLTLISKAAPGSVAGAGDTADCAPVPITKYSDTSERPFQAPWTTKCGVLPFSDWRFVTLDDGLGGNGHSDSGLAANGDIYFFSPEQLDGDRGVPNQQNLYDYRAGQVHFVATFAPGSDCIQIPGVEGNSFDQVGRCSEGPITRMQVTADDSHMAFVTADRITSYENAGHQEMYSYTPATGAIVCDSCNPDGKSATAEVFASQNGLFLTEDGRTFFSTSESLVPRDTDQGTDVYEFVDGAPHLITPGTGTAANAGREEAPGLIGVSANGTDVYFSTFDSLISEDHNGNFFKFYDARTDGGFPQPPPTQPCAAAEECHGPGTEAPTFSAQGTTAQFAGGNADPHAHQHHKKHHKRAKHKRKAERHHRRAGANHGGKK